MSDNASNSDQESSSEEAGPKDAFMKVIFTDKSNFEVDRTGFNLGDDDTLLEFEGYSIPIPKEGDAVDLVELVEQNSENGTTMEYERLSEDITYKIDGVFRIYSQFREEREEEKEDIVHSAPLVSIIITVEPLNLNELDAAYVSDSIEDE